MKTILVAYIIILSTKVHKDDVMLYDAVDRDNPKFHITVYSNMGYKNGDIIKHGFLHEIPDSLISKK